MNKDADVRYLPKGQYPHLLNGRVIDGDHDNSGVIEGISGMEMIAREPFLFDENGNATGKILGIQAIEDEMYVIGYGNIEQNLYNLIVEVEGDGHVVKDPSKNKYYFGDKVALNAIPSNKAEFVKYTGDIEGYYPASIVVVDGDKYVKAIFRNKSNEKYILIINVEGDGSVDVDPLKEEYDPGDVVNLFANPQEGWVFVRYEGDLISLSSVESILMDSTKRITAVFSKSEGNQYVINYVAVIDNKETVEEDFTGNINIDSDVKIEILNKKESYTIGEAVLFKLTETAFSNSRGRPCKPVDAITGEGKKLILTSKRYIGNASADEVSMPCIANEYIYEHVVSKDNNIFFNLEERSRFFLNISFNRDHFSQPGELYDDYRYLCDYRCPDFENNFIAQGGNEHAYWAFSNYDYQAHFAWYGDKADLIPGLVIHFRLFISSIKDVTIIETVSGKTFDIKGGDLKGRGVVKEWDLILDGNLSASLHFEKI